jgi:hypothetical protein
MRTSRLLRCALNCCVAAAMLAGCGGRAGNGVVPTSGAPDRLSYHKSLYYTGARQSFKVPTGVTQISVVARGAAGAGLASDSLSGRGSCSCGDSGKARGNVVRLRGRGWVRKQRGP